MNESPKIPSIETRKEEVRRLRESTKQLDLFILSLDDMIALVESDLGVQQRERLQSRT